MALAIRVSAVMTRSTSVPALTPLSNFRAGGNEVVVGSSTVAFGSSSSDVVVVAGRVSTGPAATVVVVRRTVVVVRRTVVVVTSTTDRARWGECVEQGARKVIPKYAPLSDIVATVRRIDNGLPTMAPTERLELLERWHDQVAVEQGLRSRLDQLTRREAEVLGMLMSGLQVGEIARRRFVSESTVRTQVKAVLAKLQVGSQLTAVGMAHQAHWTPPRSEHDGSRRGSLERTG